MFTRRNDDELISAYIDGQLDDRTRQAFETRLRAEPGLQQRVEMTRRLVQVMRQERTATPPRNFTLSRTSSVVNHAPVAPPVSPTRTVLRLASALATVIFVVAVGLDISGVGRNEQLAAPHALSAKSPSTSQPAPTAVSQYALAPTTEAASGGGSQPAAAPAPESTPQPKIQNAVVATDTQSAASGAAPLAAQAPTASPQPPGVRSSQAETETGNDTAAITVTQPQRLALAARPTNSPTPASATATPTAQQVTADEAQPPPQTVATVPEVDWLLVAGIAALVLAIAFGFLGSRPR